MNYDLNLHCCKDKFTFTHIMTINKKDEQCFKGKYAKHTYGKASVIQTLQKHIFIDVLSK